ncbi:MAG: lysophospholipid acyltransferase family protein [Nitrospiria bacterium]
MLYCIAHCLVSSLAKSVFRLRVAGAAHVPREGGVIVAANHNSYFDIPFLGCALRRRADNIAKSELFRNRFLAMFFKALGGFPVRRGRVDRKAMDEAVARLKRGRLLAYYPEGTRSKDGRIQKGKPGIGMVVAASGAPVIPAYIDGTAPVRLFGRVTVRFGKEINFGEKLRLAQKEGMHPKILYDTISKTVMEAISLLQKEQDDAGGRDR